LTQTEHTHNVRSARVHTHTRRTHPKCHFGPQGGRRATWSYLDLDAVVRGEKALRVLRHHHTYCPSTGGARTGAQKPSPWPAGPPRSTARPAVALFGSPRAAEERPRRARRSRPPSAARQQLRRHRVCQTAHEARPIASRRQHGRIAAQRPRALRSIRADGTACMAPARAAPRSKPAARTGSGALWLAAEPAGRAGSPG
jgi:hypothetical protein